MEKARVGYIDALKGFAILCVVVGHAENGYMNAGMYSDTLFLNDLHNGIYTFHMPLFFAISGFVFCKAYFHSGSKDKSWVKWHAFDFLLLYMVYSILTILVQIGFSKYVNQEVSFDMIVWLPVKPFGVFWYFYLLAQLYLIFSIHRIHVIPPKWALPALTTIGLIATNWMPNSIWFHFRSLCYYSLFFYLGVLWCEKEEYWIFRKEIIFSAAMLAIVLCFLYRSPNCTINNIATINLIVAFGFLTFLWWMFQHFSILGDNFILKWMGKHSLEIYLFHAYFTSGFRQVDRFFKIKNVYCSIVLNTIVGAGMPIAIAFIIKKLEWMNCVSNQPFL